MTTYGDIKSGLVAAPAEQGLSLDLIQIDGGTQSRATLNQHVVDEYAEALKGGAAFPPIVVFYDGKKHWLADGFHRFHAFQRVGRAKVDADVRQGTRRDAILHSVGANETHGLRRTNDDKRRAVLTLLDDGEWSKWSDGEIAKRCAVSREYVNRLRPKDTCDQVTGMERTFVHPKTGAPTTMKMTLGKTEVQTNAPRPSINDEPSPEAGPQAEASHAGTGAGMPADREGRHEGEAASVGLPTISEAQRDADTIQSAWDHAGEPGRALFLTANNLEFQAKASEDNGRISAAMCAPMAGEVSRPVVGRSATATSEGMDVTGGESAATNSSGESRERQTVGSPISKPEAPSRSAEKMVISGTAAEEYQAQVTRQPEGERSTTGEAVASPAPRNSQMPATPPVPNGRQAGRAPEVAPPPASGATPFNALSKADQIRLLRPHCQHPGTDLCGGSGRRHCTKCAKAVEEEGDAA